MKIATWNVNSLRVRLEQVLDWLEREQADVLALQETKTRDEDFPVEAFSERGFEVSFSGQPTYNGVAVISRTEIADVRTELDGFEGFSQCADLVDLHEDRVGNAEIDTLLQKLHIGHEKVVTDELNLVTDRVSEGLPAVPVVFVATVFDGVDRILVCELL